MTEGSPSKWSQAKPALVNLLTEFADAQIEFGFDIFPDGSDPGLLGGCGVTNDLLYDCGPTTETDIVTYLNDHTPNGASTPLYCGMNAFLDAYVTTAEPYAPLFTAADADSYLLVVSDGADLCGNTCDTWDSASASELGDLAEMMLLYGIKTFVIGFGNDVSPDQLNEIAINGGTDYTSFIPALNETQLETALSDIAGTVISCVYAIEDPGEIAVLDEVNFYFIIEDEEVVVPYDEDCAVGSGWTWTSDDHDAVEF